MAAVANTSFMWKVLHLPMEFFSQRNAGDISSRAASNTTVASGIVGKLAPLLVNFAMLVVYLVIMVSYSVPLSAIGLVSTVCNLALARAISSKRVNVMRMQMRGQAGLASATVSGIDMVETIKASGAEDGFFQRWSGYQAAAKNQDARMSRIDQALGIVPQICTSASNVAVPMVGVYLVMQGEFTVGMVLAFQGYLNQFTAPAQSLIGTMQSFFEMRTDMERIEDVMKYPLDPLADPEAFRGVAVADASQEDAAGEGSVSFDKLRGEVRLEGVTFGYSRLAPPLIEDFDLHVAPGKSVAFVGPSGCGKSTLAKLVSGLYRPWSGTVVLDGMPLEQIPRAVRTGSVAVVDQDIVLFNDTIANNIRLWDDSIEDYEVVLAARDAQMHDDIMQRPGGYSQVLAAGGSDMSGGQRQRIEIARALAVDPTVLIMDEATSALDARTEQQIMAKIKRRGITCIIVAHRLSTIRDCDEIVVLDRGKVVERGRHEELYRAGGLYARLVAQE